MSRFTVFDKQSKFPWSFFEILIFRVSFVFFVLHVLPVYPAFLKDLFSISISSPEIFKFVKLAGLYPQFIDAEKIPLYGALSYANLYIAFAVSFIAAIVWQRFDRTENYDNLYYWLRTVVRFRLAFTIIVYGIIKIFPLHMPFPSLSNLVSYYGDHLPWKIYWNSLGVIPWYEVFFGACEIVMGILLMFRKTVTFGAGIILGFIGNVYAANISYDLGDHVLSLSLLLMATFLFVYDIPRLWQLLARERFARANKLIPDFDQQIKKWRTGLKALFVLLVVFLSFRAYAIYKTHPYLLPEADGLAGAYGVYNVRDFVLNNDTIAYTNTDARRWQDVVFEKWATLSVKTAAVVKPDLSRGDERLDTRNDLDRSFESAGMGGRFYYQYTIDTVNHVLKLHNKNANYPADSLDLTYHIAADSSIELSGHDAGKNKISAMLEKIPKQFFVLEGRRHPIKL